MYKLICGLFLSIIASNSFSQNLQFRSSLSYGNSQLANIWGYTDASDNEYALVGVQTGLSIVNVTDPDNPFIAFTVPGVNNTWREIKTYRNYAYVTTEGGGGLTIVDLSQLPVSINSKQYTGDGVIAGQLNTIHALHCDTATGYLYLYGSNIGNGHSLFLNLSDPWNPTYSGDFIFPGGGNNAYVHDGYVLNDTMYEAHIYGGFFAVVDVRQKANPVLLATQSTPTNFTHNTWLSDDHKTLFTTDENSSSYLGAYDISDLSNIRELSRSQTSPGSGVIIHNSHILNDYAVTSWYKDGVVVTDVSRPANPVEVGKYDTYPQGSGNGFSGCWGVYPFLGSGTIVASDMNNGLFVLTPTYVRGCYLEGDVKDAISGFILPGTTVRILTTNISKISGNTGEYKAGTVNAGTYDVEFSKAGYVTRVYTGIALSNGVLTILNAELNPVPTYTIGGIVTDSISGNPLADMQVQISNADFNLTGSTDSLGNFQIAGVVAGTYEVVAGAWGYVSSCISVAINGPTTIHLELMQGYVDDFTFDFGWTVSGTSLNAWERAVPLASYDGNNNIINPGTDVASDCSNKAFVTDNGAGPYNNHDVDNGYTIITSPVFDASIYANPVLEYSRWFVNVGGSGQPNDTLKIMLNNGSTTVTIENVTRSNAGNASWVDQSYPLAYLITPTSTMQLIAYIEDIGAGHIVEGGFDNFRITGQLTVGVNDENLNPGNVSIYPNPSSDQFNFAYQGLPVQSRIEVIDLTGRVMYQQELEAIRGVQQVKNNWPAGVYLIKISVEGKLIHRSKYIRQ